MKIYLIKAYNRNDGETEVFAFSSAEKRSEFYKTILEDARSRDDSMYYWNHNWESDSVKIDPQPTLEQLN